MLAFSNMSQELRTYRYCMDTNKKKNDSEIDGSKICGLGKGSDNQNGNLRWYLP
jgi:hypothetical protein